MEHRAWDIDRGCFPRVTVRDMVAAGFFVLIGLLATRTRTAAQTSPDSVVRSSNPVPSRYWRFGAIAALGLSSHDVTLDIYQDAPGCGQFDGSVNGSSFARLFVETPLLPSLGLAVTAGAIYQHRSVGFAETFSTISRHPDGRIDEIVTQQRLDASIAGFGPFAGLMWEPAPNLRFGLAPAFLFMNASDVRQYEEIVSPFGAVFTETGDYQRPVDRRGELVFSRHEVDLSMWAGATFPVGRHLRIMPEIGANILLTSLEETIPWRATTAYFGVGLAWHHATKREPADVSDPVAMIPPDPPVGIEPDAPVQERDTLAARVDTAASSAKPAGSFWVDITAVGVDQRNKEYPDPIIEIREAPWSQSIPLIPYIFFDSGSVAVPARYTLFEDREAADAFNPDSLVSSTPISIHRQLLNVLGYRLRLRPEVAVTIVGTTSGEEALRPGERERLAAGRGETVRRYFADIWGIDERRISIVAGKPTNPSSEETADGRAENRRAEFLFDGESLARPVVVERLARIASPPAIKFYPKLYKDSNATVSVAGWHITVVQGEKELLRIDGAKDDSLTFERKYWSLGEMRVNRDLTPIRYRLEVRDASGQVAIAENSFTVLERTTRIADERMADPEPDANLEIKEFLLAGFAYNSAELRPSHIAEIHEIARVADRGSWVEVTGFTDRVGDASRNQELAMERAAGVADTLRAIRDRLSLPGIPISAVRGLGGAGEGIYDNNYPEGRIFSRMVRVTVNRRPR